MSSYYYYLDIETAPLDEFVDDLLAGLDPVKSRIISIQYQPPDFVTGRPNGELVILSDWQLGSEKNILDSFLQIYSLKNPWHFIPVGNNLLFECRFLKYKLWQHYGLQGLKLGQRPMVDLKHVLIIMNGGRFRGYNTLLGKSGIAANMPAWYATKDFYQIEQYIREEATNFAKVYAVLKSELPKIRV